MTNKFERILLSLLLGISVLLGLSFWLNTIFGFNLFYGPHWAELSKLQAEHTQISTGFYVSIGIAILIFTLGMLAIYAPLIKFKQKRQDIKTKPVSQEPLPSQEVATEQNTPIPTPQPQKQPILMSRPPRLNIPVNMAQVVAQRYTQVNTPNQPLQTAPINLSQNSNNSENPYNPIIGQMFSSRGYRVKPNPTISGFTPNLFAIAPNEVLWIGAVDQDITKLQTAIDKLKSLFEETLEDIQINVNAFMLDTKNNTKLKDESIIIFKSIEELKEFVSKLPSVSPENDTTLDKGTFDAYSEYIDTIIQYLKSIRS